MVVSKTDHACWITADRIPNEWEAKPYWKKTLGTLGIPRNCHLFGEDSNNYGFKLELKKEKYVITSVSRRSPASQAGLKNGDIVCFINGKNLVGLDYKATLKQLKGKNGTDIITVVDTKTAEFFSEQEIEITPELAEELAAYVQPEAEEQHSIC